MPICPSYISDKSFRDILNRFTTNNSDATSKNRKVRFNPSVEYKYFEKDRGDSIDVDSLLSDHDSVYSGETLSDTYSEKSEMQKYSDKLIQDHQDYCQSYGKFNKYLLDDSVLIKNNTTIDMSGKSNYGEKIGDVYNSITRRVRAKSKKIINNRPDGVVYSDDLESPKDLAIYPQNMGLYSTPFFEGGVSALND